MIPTAVTKQASPMFFTSGASSPKCPNTSATSRIPEVPSDKPLILTRPSRYPSAMVSAITVKLFNFILLYKSVSFLQRGPPADTLAGEPLLLCFDSISATLCTARFRLEAVNRFRCKEHLRHIFAAEAEVSAPARHVDNA